MKKLVLLALLLCLSLPVFAAEEKVYFKDVPEGHWANEAVYELVKMGVTKGFPDGTYLGERNITRIEIACFLSNFAKAINTENAREEKLVAELRQEAALLRYQTDVASRETSIDGDVYLRARQMVNSPRRAFLDYRLQANYLKNWDTDSAFKVALDTIDAGYDSNENRVLATQMLALESRFKLWTLNWLASFGPAQVFHKEVNGNCPSYNNTVFNQPQTELGATTQINKLTLGGAYVARQQESSGKVTVNEIRGQGKYKFGQLDLEFWPRYIFNNTSANDCQAELIANYQPTKSLFTQVAVAAGLTATSKSRLAARLVIKLLDPLVTGTNLVFRFNKVGNQFRNDDLAELDLIPLNLFDREILDGTCDLGLNVSQQINKIWTANIMSDYVTTGDLKYGQAYAGTYWLWELGLACNFTDTIQGGAHYRAYQVPSGIAQFNDPVPTQSETIVLDLTAAF
jgi:hypothetical protein